MKRFVRTAGVCLSVLVLSAALADARGGGVGGGGGGGKRGRRGKSASAQQERLAHDSFRRDVLSRSRLRDW